MVSIKKSRLSDRAAAQLGAMLRAARTQNCWTLADVASRASSLLDSGNSVSRHHVMRLERMPLQPIRCEASQRRLCAVATVLAVDMGEMNRLLGGVYSLERSEAA